MNKQSIFNGSIKWTHMDMPDDLPVASHRADYNAAASLTGDRRAWGISASLPGERDGLVLARHPSQSALEL